MKTYRAEDIVLTIGGVVVENCTYDDIKVHKSSLKQNQVIRGIEVEVLEGQSDDESK